MNLQLPEKCLMPGLRGEYDYYGASNILSAYCGIDLLTKPLGNTGWVHGWVPSFWDELDSRILVGQNLDNKNKKMLTARNNEESILISQGFLDTHAIGLTPIYLKHSKIDRIKGSLLVMPGHSLDCTRHNLWKFNEYVDYIDAISAYFTDIYICVHPSCIKNGYWIKEFQSKGYKIIEGMNLYDKNAYYRLQYLMSSFEYVTTNAFGSHIAYASYFGAKVSLYGSYCEYQEEDFAEVEFYLSNPDLLSPVLVFSSEDKVKKELNQFALLPQDAKTNKDWADYELGYDNKKTPKQIREILEWSYTSSFLYESKRNLIQMLEVIGIKSYIKKVIGKH